MADTEEQTGSYLNDEIVTESSLSDFFDKSVELHRVVDESDSTSEKYKNGVKCGISQLEEITKKVNMLSLFSSNEVIDEVATADIKYLLLPALLGSFTLKKSSSSTEERKEILSLAEQYFIDYMQRFKEYEVSSVECASDPTSEDNSTFSNNAHRLPKNMEELAKQRDNKIARFKRLKSFREREKELQNTLKIKKDEEILREYFIVLLKKWAITSLEELEDIKMEKDVLQHCPKTGNQSHKNAKSQEKPKPLKPVIITRNELQKKIYGVGYPSVPVMTVDEFYQQRYPENAEKGPASAAEMNNLMYMAANPDVHKKELEKEDEEKERKVENDDPELLQHTRAFDDWKDVNRRGCGNRKNMG